MHTCNRPSRLLGMVTHLLGCPGQLSAFSNSSMAPLVFFSFLTSASTAFSAHFSSSSPCFQPNSFLTAGLVNENRLFIDEMVDDERPESNSSTSMVRKRKPKPERSACSKKKTTIYLCLHYSDIQATETIDKNNNNNKLSSGYDNGHLLAAYL